MKNVLTCTKYAFLTFLNYFRSLLIDGLEKIFRQSNLQGQLYSATIFDNYLTMEAIAGDWVMNYVRLQVGPRP